MVEEGTDSQKLSTDLHIPHAAAQESSHLGHIQSKCTSIERAK